MALAIVIITVCFTVSLACIIYGKYEHEKYVSDMALMFPMEEIEKNLKHYAEVINKSKTNDDYDNASFMYDLWYDVKQKKENEDKNV